MKKTLPFAILLSVILFNSCKKVDDIEDPLPPNELEIQVTPYFGSEKLYLDSVYTTNEGYLVKFEEIRFYATNLAHGSHSFFDVGLFNYRHSQNQFIKINGEPTNYPSLQGILGVDSSRNHADPSAFSNSNPLNIINANEMHWGWNPGYIFTYIDAKLDTIVDSEQNFSHILSYHVGNDAYRQDLNFPTVNWTKVSSNLYRANMILDLKKVINGTQVLDLKTENISHSSAFQEAISLKVIKNFAQALSFE